LIYITQILWEEW